MVDWYEGASPAIRFAEDPYKPLTTHVIAARITAENPDEGFKPTSGSIRARAPLSGPSTQHRAAKLS